MGFLSKRTKAREKGFFEPASFETPVDFFLVRDIIHNMEKGRKNP